MDRQQPKDRHQQGLELIRRGVQCGRLHQLENGILYLAEGLSMIDPLRDPRLTLGATHNLALFYAHLGMGVLARSVLARARQLYRRTSDPVMQSRHVWLQGTVARIAGNYAEAVDHLDRAQRAFRELGYERQAEQVGEELEEVRGKLQGQVAAA